MNSREKLTRALNHEDGPIPLDLGSTPVTGAHVTVVEGLRKHFGLEKRPVKVYDPYQMLGEFEDDLKKALGIDILGVSTPQTIFGFPLEQYKEWTAPWGQDLLVPGEFQVTASENGLSIYPQGDISVRPCALMPPSGYFFDTLIRQDPIDESALNPEDNLEEFGIVSDDDLDYYEARTATARASGSGVITLLPGMAFGDIALVPAPFLKSPRGIRDIAEWYISTAIRKDYVRAIFDKQLEYALQNLVLLHNRIGERVDVVYLCGTDFGTQTGTFCSLTTFNELWKPYYREINDWIHRNTSWKTFKHCCGSVIDFIEPFIDCGFDILNPVQCSALNMDPKILKDRFGDRIVFWGGGVDTQHTLPFGAPEEVRKQVLERCEIFSRNGGFVFSAIHNIQARVPIENVIALFDALQEWGG